MRLDKYSNPVFDENDIFNAIYQGHTFDRNNTYIIESKTQDLENLEQELDFEFSESYNGDFEISDYDQACQTIWNMPKEYKYLDIEDWLRKQAPPWDPETNRLEEELEEFKARNMLDLLRWMKYFVDTCRSKKLVWGVGRGSSVASYVLYLISVHKIDPIKYNLDWKEFLR